jgi:hypothetical protein
MMTNLNIAHQRLLNQHLAAAVFEKPEQVVQWLGAVQSQDYAGAKWALGLRLQGATDDDIERAFTDGSILRTHLMRPTWHFVTPADIRWMLALTAPRVNAASAHYFRKLDLDRTVFTRSSAALVKALKGGKQLTREELRGVLERAGIAADSGMRLGYIMMRAELDGIVCSGARRGKQFTYALLEERVPQAKALQRDEALFELTKRYFRTRGPATVRDFAWWSGLTMVDTKRGIELAQSELVNEEAGGQTYWLAASVPSPRGASHTAHLLPNYDEYFIGFKDRSAILDVVTASKLDERSNALSAHIIVLDGQVVGGWKRTLKKNAVVVELNLLAHLGKAEQRAVALAAQKYGAFLELPVELA